MLLDSLQAIMILKDVPYRDGKVSFHLSTTELQVFKPLILRSCRLLQPKEIPFLMIELKTN